MNQDTFVFTNEQLQAFIKKFVVEVPALLEKSPTTAEWVRRITNLQLLDSLTSKFTVAVVGQMKAGKSTLLNALVGQDLAETDTSETTATINRFVYGSGAECDKFRIHWKDDAVDPTDEPLESRSEWVGKVADVEKVKFLEFRADAAFLEDYHLIDTPGTRSRLPEHEKVIRDFLAEKQREGETLEHGSRANAVLYVLNPRVRQDDQELLRSFGAETRLPGTSPYNSIAVIQKWEELLITTDDELKRYRQLAEEAKADCARFLPEKLGPEGLKPDPLTVAQVKCERIQAALADEVASVIPVSGLLANQLKVVPDDVWPALAKLGTESPEEAVVDLLLFWPDDVKDVPGVSLDTDEWRRLNHVLRFSVRLAYARGIDNGAKLRRTVEEASGIQTLEKALEERFIASQDLLKALGAMSKAVSCMQGAEIDLRNQLTTFELWERSKTILGQHPYNTDLKLREVRDYINRSLIGIKEIESLYADLSEYRENATSHVESFQADIKYRKMLTAAGEGVIPDSAKEFGVVLLGKDGGDVWTRLGFKSQEEMGAQGLEIVKSQINVWRTLRRRVPRNFWAVCDHVIARLHAILDYLENTTP